MRKNLHYVIEKLAWMRDRQIWPNGLRYLWTDAYGVILLVSLYKELGRKAYLDEAESVVANVDQVLGRPRGIRIGEAPDRDGQYFNYLTGSAIFQHAPIPADALVSAREDEWHFNFSGLAGMSFVTFATASFFAGVAGRERLIGPVVAAFAGLMSVLIFRAPDYAGVWQRLLFGVAFAWLILLFSLRATGPAPVGSVRSARR